MPYVPIAISEAVGEKTLIKGKPTPAKNNPDDVRKIQALLKKVFGPSAPVFTDGKCDGTMKGAIAEFQKVWGGTVDSTVDPHGQAGQPGQTLRHLNRLANPLVLKKPIAINVKVVSGGYTIGYTTCDGGPLPPAGKGYTLHLGFPAEMNSIEVTGRPANDLLTYHHTLGQVLAIFEKLACWAPKQAQCQLYLKYKGATVSTSNTQPLDAPVQPHNGRMLPLDEVNNGPKLTYQGDVSAKQFWGRMFAQVPGYDKNVFIYAGSFETDNNFRGFDCITYAGTTCGASNMHMADSLDLASSLGATTSIDHVHQVIKDPKTGKESIDHTHAKDPKTGKETGVTVQLEKADQACVKDFFATTPTGYFLMMSWGATAVGHIVIVANGEVHEFTPPGYRCTKKVTEWLELPLHKAKKFTVRGLPKKPARAV